MKKDIAINILNNLIEYSKMHEVSYNVRILSEDEYKGGFHQWVDGKEILGIAQISDEYNSYYFIFIDWWMNNDNYYIVILSKNKVSPLIEFHKINKEYRSMNLEWRYKPSKRDGKNEERRACFKKYYGDIISRIEVPNNEDDVEEFLVEIFNLVDKRIKSDNITFKEESKHGFPEGRVYERLHKKRERNSKLIQQVKAERLAKDKKLTCEICGFNFFKVYEDLGREFIEAHHIIPVSELEENYETKKEDIALVCSNCHSMLHRKRPWATIEEMKKLIKYSEVDDI